MKLVLAIYIVFFCFQINAQPILSENGHPEHFIVGAIVAGSTSYLVYKKTDNKFKAWIIGATASSALGLIKELVDPILNNSRSRDDLKYNVLGSLVGASIVIPLRRRRPKKNPNITAAFK
jgi:hypothetical protein